MSLFSHQLDLSKLKEYKGHPDIDIDLELLYWLARADDLLFKAKTSESRNTCNNLRDALRSNNEDNRRIAQITIILKENEFNF